MEINPSYSIIITKSAKQDLNNIISYVALDNKNAAKKNLENIKSKIAKLYQFPEQGRIVPEFLLFTILTYRELIESPWRIIYKIENSKVIIIAILDGRRNIEDLLLNRLLR